MDLQRDFSHMRSALDEAKKCVHVPTAFNVGCILVSSTSQAVISTGFSREIEGNTHAEQCALSKLDHSGTNIPNEPLVMYTTMEPCSTRLSGNKSCTQRILEFNSREEGEGKAKVTTVVVGTGEPDDFVVCEGEKLLKEAGVEVVWLGKEGEEGKKLMEECLRVARGEKS
ncbi:cytidine deaminase-like protein [Atractiella rhizophila]|nr:cytidine deaminase-like protein [Atractiella rhizophila]